MNKRKTFSENFIEFNRSKHLAGEKKLTLLAVSGGIDSAVMCDLFSKAVFPFAIAHCNFQLRGKESNADEAFVKDLAKQYRAEFFTKEFDTMKYAEQKKISIQVAARELRYEWFEELHTELQLKNANRTVLIATAHHLNDNIETIIFNLTKGTGIKGLRGIPVRNGNVIRPLLFASRNDIETYCKKNNLKYREDSSNAEDKYARNKIRHHIIPVLKEINPSLEETFKNKIDLFTELEELYERRNKNEFKQLFLQRKDDIYIPLRKLLKTKNASSVLLEYLKQYNFTTAQVADMLSVTKADSGKQFLSSQARIIKDRRFFILTKLPEKDFTVKLIEENEKEVQLTEGKLVFVKSAIANLQSAITAGKSIAHIDYSKLEFPLVIRRWKEGDYFYPFGMKMKKKKLKKFFNDEKVPLHEKEKVWVLESNQKIIWVVGYRIDERFKVTERTKDVLKISTK